MSQSNENSKQQQLPELPKTHPYKSPEVNLTKTSTRSDQSSINIGMKTIRISQNNNNNNNEQSNLTQQSFNESYNKSPAKQDPPQKSQIVSASSDGKVADPVASSTSGTGLVRRLSVTARPGDIFYKVKDVTESSSSTDTSESPNSSVTKVSSTEETINPSKSYTITTNNTEEPSSAPVVQQQAPPVVQPPQQQQQHKVSHLLVRWVVRLLRGMLGATRPVVLRLLVPLRRVHLKLYHNRLRLLSLDRPCLIRSF